jgi:dTDP-4-dehydrorhamnose reductase
LLSQAAEQCEAQILQIATDCVYSGSKGNYSEHDKHDALDVYGKTKSLGEAYADNIHHLRCSIIGPEPKNHVSLLDWFLGQPKKSTVSGYVNHKWNGVTTLHFARLCQGIISQGLRFSHMQHIIPTGLVSKAELLGYFAREYHREDITITAAEAEVVIDRTLTSIDDTFNRKAWSAAGYTTPPTVEEMVAELSAFDYSLINLY